MEKIVGAVILSEAKDLALPAQGELREGRISYIDEKAPGEILRCAQNDSKEAFFRNLFNRTIHA